MPQPDFRVAICPVPDFTLLAFAGFVDTLRLAADEGDRSRPLRCRWDVLGRAPLRASCGVELQPTAAFPDPSTYHYIVVVGGLLHAGPREPPELLAYLRAAAAARVPLVGLCTGAFTLARAGLMAGRAACVSWFHHDDYLAEFPGHLATADQLFLDDGDRVTCAGGTSAVHLASHLVERHLGAGAAAKGLRIMIEEAAAPSQPPPGPFALPANADPRLRRALLAMERRLADPTSIADIAAAAGASERTLTRLFRASLGCAPASALRRMRLARAQHLRATTRLTLAAIAAECGFADAAHLSRARSAAPGPGKPTRIKGNGGRTRART